MMFVNVPADTHNNNDSSISAIGITMAYLFDIATRDNIPLSPHHTFGRLASAVDTHIDKPYISKLHAAIEWNGLYWQIKHLGLNASWINGQTLEQGEVLRLKKGDHIQLADTNDAGYKVTDLAAPTDLLWPLIHGNNTDVIPIKLTRYNLLPNAQNPELALFYEEKEQRWLREPLLNGEHDNAPKTFPVTQRQVIHFAGQRWQFIWAQNLGATELHSCKTQKLNDYLFDFDLSLDEETTQLRLQKEKEVIDLGIRSHHYLLLQLVRHRAEDVLKGIKPCSQGWMYTDKLSTELGLDSTHINIHIFRLRKQIADALPAVEGQSTLIERRGGKIRFGGSHYRIIKGDEIINNSLTLTHATG